MLDGRMSPRGPCIVHQNVDAGMRGFHPRNEGMQRRAISKVALVSVKLPARRAHSSLDRAALKFKRRAHTNDVGARFCQRLGHRQANTPLATGHERDFSCESKTV